MQVHDEGANVGIVDGLLRFRLPGGVSSGVVRVSADDAELVGRSDELGRPVANEVEQRARRARRAATSAPCTGFGRLQIKVWPVNVVSMLPAPCTKRSAAARSQSCPPGLAKIPSSASEATRASRNAGEGIRSIASIPCLQ
jgi:hypothetical protein